MCYTNVIHIVCINVICREQTFCLHLYCRAVNVKFRFVNMNNRIREIITALKLSDGEFADMVGIKRSTLSHCLSGRNDVSKEIIVKIHNALPDISVNWLMFGEGESGIPVSSHAGPEINGDLFKSLPDIPGEGESGPEYSKENGLNLPYGTVKLPDNKPLEGPTEADGISTETESIKSAVRKIDKIILFYSDNTFEIYKPDTDR